jgi:hypothetical protein
MFGNSEKICSKGFYYRLSLRTSHKGCNSFDKEKVKQNDSKILFAHFRLR